VPDDIALDEPVADRRAPALPVLAVGDPGLPARGAWDRCRPPVALRPSQAHALDRLDGRSACVVLPPGTGKTLVGLEAARRLARRTLVLVPSTVVRAQWLRAWDAFGGDRPHPVPAGTSADLRAAVTVLTYQSLSAWDRGADDQDVEDSTDGALAERRRAAVRGVEGADLLSLLHPRGRELVERAAALGPWTLVVDECAHLLDTWGLLVPALAAALGDETVVVGLTATPARELGDRARAVHDQLFPDPDVEVVLPDAVVRGEVALVRDLVHVTRPTPDEDALLAGDRGRFSELRDELLRARAGSLPLADWLRRRLHERRSDVGPGTWRALERAEPALARAGLRLVSAGLLELPPGAVLREEHRAPADAQDWAAVLGAYAEEHLRPSTSAQDARLLAAVTHVLPSLGWTLTGRGLRATTSAFDRVCAVSAAKAAGARRVLAAEFAARRTDLRSLVVCGSDGGRGDGLGGRSRREGAAPAPGSAGAVFVELATSEAASELRPVLCTGRTVALRREDLADFRSRAPHRLADRLVAEPYAGHRSLVRLSAGDEWAAPTWVPLVQDWLEAGGTGVVVSTRGLLGEGWDAPSLNVVVDLTAAGAPGVATAVRGRVLRRDPDRPEEVVHAWTVTCVADDHPRGGVDHQRALDAAQRRLGLAEDGLVEAGAGHLDPELGPGAGAPGPAVREAVHARALALVAAPERTRRGWAAQGRAPGTTRTVLRVRTGRPLGMPSGVVPPSLLSVTRTLGSPAPAPLPRTPRRVRLWPLPVAAGVVTSATGTVLASAAVGAGSGLATGVVLGGAVAGQRWVSQSRALRRAPADASAAVLRQLAEAVADALRTAGGAPVGAEAVRVEQRADGEVELRLDTGSDADGSVSVLFAECLEELLLPLGEPRWLVSRTVLPVPDGPAARRLTAARAVGRPVEVAVTWHAVPSWLSRSRSRVDAFDAAWRAHVGGGRLVLATDPEGQSLVELLRGEDPFAVTTRVRSVWRGGSS
jgi:superfamily II DNA or RNA helicase